MMRGRSIYAVFAIATACGGGERPATPHTAPSASASASAASVAPPASHDVAYKLVITSAACWLGGLWGDAEGEAGAAERRAGTARRCAAVVTGITGQDDPTKVEALRVLDPTITDALVAKVKELAAADALDDAHQAALVRLESTIVAAAREAATARRATAKIRADVEKIRNDKDKLAARERDADKLSADEAAVVPALRAGAALDALVKFSATDYATDAHAIGVLVALLRVHAGQDLPKHMKLYTVAPAYAAVFGVAPPQLPERAKDRLKPGTWLAYVTSVAKACGHPVPDTATKPKEKERLAWSGVLAGFADRLSADEAQLKNPDLLDAVKGATARLEARAKEAADHAKE